jgi:transposase-like protein
VVVRSCRCLNNIVEQDHRAIKRRCSRMTGFKSFWNAAIALAGIDWRIEFESGNSVGLAVILDLTVEVTADE